MLSPYSPPSPLLLFFLLLLFCVFLPPSLLSPTPLTHSPLRWTSPHDPCYHLDGRPRHCLSEFINAAYGVPVLASHPSRASPERNVTSLTDLHNPHNLTCLSGEPWNGDWTITVPLGRRFEITYISLQFCQQGELSEGLSISILKSMDHGHSWRPLQYYSSDCLTTFGQPPQSVALTRHQETEPLCSDPRPLQKHRGGAVLAFSTLDGRPSAADLDFSPVLQDWVTATDIRVVFHKPQGHRAGTQQTSGKAVESGSAGGVLRWRAGTKGEGTAQADRERGGGGGGGGLLWGMEGGKELMKIEVENSKENRRGGERTEKAARRNSSNKSPSQEETQNTTRKERDGDAMATGSPSSPRKGKGRGRKKETLDWKPCQGGGCDWVVEGTDKGLKSRELRRRRNHREGRGSRGRTKTGASLHLPSALSAPPVRPPISLSDLQVGGRCKCNGHASRCRRDSQGQAVCQCEHHTAGADCDVCKPFYYDRPWQRATPSQPHPCVPCECNGHSTKCRFSMELYQQSGRNSGGVCLKCRHHTAGRHCQFCQNGYSRDPSKPMTHRKACQPCQCHPLGAVGRWCNQSTGQCLCREGVTGQRCNRCAPGYKQGKSPLRPCLKIEEVVAPTPVYQPQYSRAEECQSYCHPSSLKVRMNLETFCLKDYVLKVQVKGMERSGPWWQFSIWVQSVFRVGLSRVRRGQQALWVPDRDLGCGCPALQVGRSFLLIGAEEGGRNWAPGEHRLVADRSTIALHWREHWSPKLRGFRGQDKKGKCLEVAQENLTTRSRHTHGSVGEYTPPHLEQGPQVETHTPHTSPQRADTHTVSQDMNHSTHTHSHTHKHKSQHTHTHHTGGSQRHTHHTHRIGHDEGHKTAVRSHETTTSQFTQNALQHAPDPSSTPTAVSFDDIRHLFSTACPTLPPHDNPV